MNAEISGPSPRFVLYRFYDIDERLLYIGKSIDLRTRFVSHMRTKLWWNKVVKMVTEDFLDDLQLLNAEKEAIINENPIYNIQHKQSSIILTDNVDMCNLLLEASKRLIDAEIEIACAREALAIKLKQALEMHSAIEISKLTGLERTRIYSIVNRDRYVKKN